MVMEGFLNWGDFVGYPLDEAVDVSSSSSLAPALHIRQGLADAGFICGPRSNFNAAVYDVYLYGITVNAGAVSYDFRSDCMPALHWLMEFPFGTEFGCTVNVDCTYIGSEIPSPGHGNAWATAGDLDSIIALGDGLYRPVEHTPVAPARVQDATNAFVHTLNIGNMGRPCPGNCCSSSSLAPDDVFIVAEDIVGEVIFKEGFNCSIRVRESDNSIEIGAEPNAGVGPVCEDLIIKDESIRSDDANCPDSDSCDGYIKSINGLVTSGALTVVGGPGVVVTPNNALHRVIVESEENRLCAASSSFSV